MADLSLSKALKNKEALIALGQTTVHLWGDNAADAPWDKATSIECGSVWRLSGPASATVNANIDGITFCWSLDFETRDANGSGYSLFDRPRLRETILKLPISVRRQFGRLLADKVLPGLQKRTQELRDALNAQSDSEDCVRGLIAFAHSEAEAA